MSFNTQINEPKTLPMTLFFSTEKILNSHPPLPQAAGSKARRFVETSGRQIIPLRLTFP
jgi:hypothetical protein